MRNGFHWFAGVVFLAGCEAAPSAQPVTATMPATRQAVAATIPDVAATRPKTSAATEPTPAAVLELPGKFYTLPSGAAVESFDGLFLAELVENQKVVGVFLANGSVVVNDNGTLKIDVGGLHIGGMRINRNLTLYRISANGAQISGGGPVPPIDGDLVAGYMAALTKNPKLKLGEYLKGTALKDAVGKLTGLEL